MYPGPGGRKSLAERSVARPVAERGRLFADHFCLYTHIHQQRGPVCIPSEMRAGIDRLPKRAPFSRGRKVNLEPPARRVRKLGARGQTRHF